MYSSHDTVPTLSVLARLRAFARESSTSPDDLHHVTRQQAALLRGLLGVPIDKIAERVSALIPVIRITKVQDMPLPGFSFWASKSWHVQVRASDEAPAQAVTVLRELKRIIDHPLYARRSTITGNELEAVAVQFANEVLTNTTMESQKGESLCKTNH